MTKAEILADMSQAMWDAGHGVEVEPRAVEAAFNVALYAVLHDLTAAERAVGKVEGLTEAKEIAQSARRHHDKKYWEVNDRALQQSHLMQSAASDKIALAIAARISALMKGEGT